MNNFELTTRSPARAGLASVGSGACRVSAGEARPLRWCGWAWLLPLMLWGAVAVGLAVVRVVRA